MGRENKHFKILDSLRDNKIYIGPVRLVRKSRVGRFFQQGNPALRLLERTTHFGFPRGRTRGHNSPNFGLIYILNSLTRN
jgi:hypothetical protein